MDVVQIDRNELRLLLIEATNIGFQRAFEDLVCYHYKDACKRLNISYNTLQKRILEGKIRPVDGRITGAEIRRYLTEHVGNR